MTPTLWQFVRELIGLPGKTRLTEIPSDTLALHFFTAKQKAGDCAPGQENKRYAEPARRA